MRVFIGHVYRGPSSKSLLKNGFGTVAAIVFDARHAKRANFIARVTGKSLIVTWVGILNE
jgi:hypothetical protein